MKNKYSLDKSTIEAIERAKKQLFLSKPAIDAIKKSTSQLHNIQKSFLISTKYINSLNQAFKITGQYVETIRGVGKSISAIAGINQQTIEQFSNVFSSVKALIDSDIFKQFAKMANKIKDQQEREEVLNALILYSWFITPSLPVEEINELVIKQKAKGRAISNYMVKLFNDDNFAFTDKVTSRWSFKYRMRIIDEGIDAFRQGNNYAAICTLLPQVEGIALDYVNRNNGVFAHVDKKSPKSVVSNAFNEGLDKTIETQALLKFIENIAYVKALPGIKPKRSFHRHKILHGEGKNYGNKPNVVRCLLLLDALSWLA